MNPPIQEYNYLKNLDNIWDEAYFTLFEKYMKYKLRGQDKVIQIDETDQESVVASRNGGFPLPGFMYTFIYKGADFKIGSPPEKIREYKDLVPIIFCMGREGRTSFSGLNMNLLPPGARLQFLQTFYDTFSDFLEREVDVLAENQKLALNKRFISYIDSGKGQEMIRLFSRATGENYKFAYRKYISEKVDNFRMIEYAEWKYLPFYNPKDAFRKLNQNQIYKLYGRSK
jgi:hypothetical protein